MNKRPSTTVERIERPEILIREFLEHMVIGAYSADEDERFASAEAASKISEEMYDYDYDTMFKECVLALENDCLRFRLCAAWMVLSAAQTEIDRRRAWNILVTGLKEGDVDEKFHIIFQASMCAEIPGTVCSELVSLLEDEDPLLRCGAASLLLQTSSSSTKVMEILHQEIRGNNSHRALMAAKSLAKAGIRVNESVHCLRRLLRAEDRSLNLSAVVCLCDIGEEADSAISDLIELVSDPTTDETVRAQIALLITKIRRDEIVTHALIDLFFDENEHIVQNAAFGLINEKHKVISESGLHRLIEMLDHPKGECRKIAACSISELSEQKVVAIPHLIDRLMIEPEDNVCHILVHALHVAGKPAVPFLIEALKVSPYRSGALIAMALHGQAELAAEELVHLMLNDSDPRVREAGAWILYGLGPKASNIIPTIVDVFKNGNTEQRKNAVVAVAAVGPDGIAIVPELVKALEEEDESIRAWAERGLIAIGGRGRPLIEELAAKSAQQVKIRLESIIEQLPPVESTATDNKYDWVSDRRLLRVFVIAGKLFREHDGLSYRKLETLFAEMEETGKLPDGIKTSANYIRKSIRKLEELLEEKAGQTSQLVTRESRSKTRLTRLGKEILERVERYLKAKEA